MNRRTLLALAAAALPSLGRASTRGQPTPPPTHVPFAAVPTGVFFRSWDGRVWWKFAPGQATLWTAQHLPTVALRFDPLELVEYPYGYQLKV